MKIKSLSPIEPKMARCISVESSNKLFTIGEKSELLTHNSVCQQNIIFGCLLRPKDWVILGIDLKRVELSRYKKFGMNVATELGPAVDFLRFAQAVMMKRYERLEEAGENNFRDLAVPGQALMVMIDEAGELLSPTGSKALIGSTKIPTPMGYKLLKDIEIGETVYDNYNNPTEVINKYTPSTQKKYKISISNDSTGESEAFVAGEEHFWTVYTKDKKGTISGPYVWTTNTLNEFMQTEAKLPKEERTQLKIKKGGTPLTQDTL